jgi:hypothetical protein
VGLDNRGVFFDEYEHVTVISQGQIHHATGGLKNSLHSEASFGSNMEQEATRRGRELRKSNKVLTA